MKPYDTDTVLLCLKELTGVVQQIDQIIIKKSVNNNTTPDLDLIAIASFMAPLVNPPQYADGKLCETVDWMSKHDEECRLESEHWRSTISGKFTIDFYNKYRKVDLVNKKSN